jgi:hypothetical protein
MASAIQKAPVKMETDFETKPSQDASENASWEIKKTRQIRYNQGFVSTQQGPTNTRSKIWKHSDQGAKKCIIRF